MSLQDSMNKAVHQLSQDKLDRYEVAGIKYILKHLKVKQSVPDEPKLYYLKDEVPEWGLGGPAVKFSRLEHNWLDLLSPNKTSPVERLFRSSYKELSHTDDYLVLVFKWEPSKFMIMTEQLFSAPHIVTSTGLYVYTLDAWLDYYYPGD